MLSISLCQCRTLKRKGTRHSSPCSESRGLLTRRDETLYLEGNSLVRKYFQQRQQPLLFIERWAELQKNIMNDLVV